jgi:hypothetical protein
MEFSTKQQKVALLKNSKLFRKRHQQKVLGQNEPAPTSPKQSFSTDELCPLT